MEPAEENVFNQPLISENWVNSVVIGINSICHYLIEHIKNKISSVKRNVCYLAFDGFIGAEWEKIISRLAEKLSNEEIETEIIDISSYYKSDKEIKEIVSPYLESDPFFGRVYRGRLEDFINKDKIDRLKFKFSSRRNKKPSDKNLQSVVLFYGCGAANRYLRRIYDFILFIDMTREEFIKRARKKTLGFIKPENFRMLEQVADVGLSVYLFKVSNYIYYPVLERYKKSILRYIDFYIDGNMANEPKLLPREIFEGILSVMAEHLIRLKPLYTPSPWGGQWIKNLRKLPSSLVNCAWAFEAVAPEMSLKVSLGRVFLEIPFLTFLIKEGKKMMGEYATKKFDNFFPIRIHYDDSMNGGNMAIQVHPSTQYVKKYFDERIGQDESYYIVLTGEGSRVFLGLVEGIDRKKFYEEAKRSEMERVPLDYEKYIHSIESKPGDLFLIPAGTVHALGRNQVALEIGNSYGYTFHIYDYLRPDLSGRLRPIHLDHAFRVIRSERTAHWVNKHLKPSPKLVRFGEDWAEYCLGKRRDIYYEIHRLEFKSGIEDDTKGKFHILTLVEGKSIIIQSKEDVKRKIKLNFSETVIIPAFFGSYYITNLGDTPCKVLKVFLKNKSL